MKKSTRTTLTGWAMFLGVLLIALGSAFDSNPETMADWAGVSQAFGGLGLGFGGLLNGVFSRDDNVTSEGNTAAKDRL